jgi:hypothetical protein
MEKKVILSPSQEKRINKAISEHKALKKISELISKYKGNSIKILKIKQAVNKKLNK